MTKKDAICDAALELFATKGIRATTTREIAEQAGAAEGTLYRHFEGKNALAEWLYKRCATQLHDQLTERVRPATAPAERLEALVRGVFDFFAQQPTSCTYLLSARSDNGDPDAPSDDDLPPPMQLFVDTLETGMETGDFRSASAPLAAGWILAMIQRTVLFLKSGSLAMNKQEAIDQTVEAALRLVEDDAHSSSN
jgi:AcrR family transcriptional regulator